MNEQPRWHLRSLADHDTHLGAWSGVSRSVHAVCGAEFRPVALPTGGYFLPGPPPDPDQICGECYRIGVAGRFKIN